MGTELPGHRIVSVIGRGSMAVVYLAEHLRLGRRVALKVLDPEMAEDEAFRERFIRESRIAAGLDHPNVVTVYDAGEADGVLYPDILLESQSQGGDRVFLADFGISKQLAPSTRLTRTGSLMGTVDYVAPP